LVSLTTDFGQADPYVGLMKAAIKQHNLRASIIDLCHEVPAHDVAVGAFILSSALGRFPPGTVHVAVVDPGVGSARRLVAVSVADCYWLAPDNGLLTEVLIGRESASVRALEVSALKLAADCQTFHGRDLLAPVAGMLSSGCHEFSSLGPVVDDPVLLSLSDEPQVLWVDRYGNLVTNFRFAAGSHAPSEEVSFAGRKIPLFQTYAQAQVGDLLALVNSYGLLEVAVREGRAADVLELGRGARIEIDHA